MRHILIYANIFLLNMPIDFAGGGIDIISLQERVKHNKWKNYISTDVVKNRLIWKGGRTF